MNFIGIFLRKWEVFVREEKWVWRVVLGESEPGLGWLPHKYYCTLIGATLDNVLTFSNCPK